MSQASARFPHNTDVWICPAAEPVLRANPTRPAWLAARRLGIGGSDIAAIVGLSRWATPYSVWLDKTGKPLPEPEGDAIEWGHRLEPVLADHFTDTTGIRTVKAGLMRSTRTPIALASLDRLTDCTGHCPAPDGIWEGKTTSWRLADEWDDDQVPDAAELQTQWYLGVTGRSHAHVSVLVDGRTPLQRTVQADPALFEVLTGEAARFWTSYVVPNTAPPIMSPLALGEVKARYTDGAADPKVVDPREIDALLFDLAAAKVAEKNAKAQRDLHEARLREIIGDASELWAAGELRVTLKTIHRKSYTAAESTYRRLTIKEH